MEMFLAKLMGGNFLSYLHYLSDPWTAASLEEDSGLGPEITNTFPFYYLTDSQCNLDTDTVTINSF